MHTPDVIQYLFDGLAAEWKRTRPHSSRVKDMVAVPAYREIVKMGRSAIPCIMREFTEGRIDHWFPALHEITGADPVKVENRGRLRAMADDWLFWWKGQQTSCEIG